MDDITRISDQFPIIGLDSCSQAIQDAIGELHNIFGKTDVRLIDWYRYGIGAAITVPVNLPARGTVGEIDIRSQEPVVLVFNKTRFPYQSPKVFVDRVDFPAEDLPHLNPAQHGQPVSLCLHRGHVDDWFVEHSVTELVQRAQSWLEDAAGNRLIRSQDFFEATRLEIRDVTGVSVYDPSRVDEFIGKQWQARAESGWGVLVCSPLRATSPTLSIKLDDICLPSLLNVIRQAPKNARYKAPGSFYAARQILGLVVYVKPDSISSKHIAKLPNTLQELKQFALHHELPLNEALQQISSVGLSQGAVPVILAIQRPRPLIGTQSSIELLNFMAKLSNNKTSNSHELADKGRL